MALQSQHRKCLMVREAQSQDGVWVLASPRDMELPLPGGMCYCGQWQEEGSVFIAVMNRLALEVRGCSIDSASPVPAASKTALLMPAGLACLSLCHSSSGAALAAGHCQPHIFASNFANSASAPAHPPCVQRCLAGGLSRGMACSSWSSCAAADLSHLPASPQARECCPCSTDLQSKFPMEPTVWAALRGLCLSGLSPHAPARQNTLAWE